MIQRAATDSHQGLRENGKPPSAAAGVREGIDELVYDMVSLAELQAQLFAIDAHESLQKAKAPIVQFLSGLVLGLGAVPVLLGAVAEAVHQLADWDRWLAYLTTGAAGVTLAGLLVWLAWHQSGAAVSVFRRSRAELIENVRWIKYAIARGRRPPT